MHKMIKYLIKLLNKSEVKQLYLLIIVYFLTPILNLTKIYMLFPILNKIISQTVSIRLIFEVSFLAFLSLLTGIVNLFKTKYSSDFCKDNARNWAIKIYELYNSEDLLNHNKKSISQAIAGINSDTEICSEIIVTYIDLIILLLSQIGYSLFAVYISGFFGILCGIVIFIITILIYVYTKKRIEEYSKRRRFISIKLNSLITTVFGSYKEIKIDSRNKHMQNKFEQTRYKYAQIHKEFFFINAKLNIILQNVMQAVTFFFITVLLALGIQLANFFANIVVFISLLFNMFSISNMIVTDLNNIQSAKKNCDILINSMERYKQIKKEELKLNELRLKQVTLKDKICIKNLSFQYPNSSLIFENASIDITSGCSTAIIGISGSGKTTFLDLVLGLLHPQKGHIWYDDYDIVDNKDNEGTCRVDLGTIVSYIPQTVYLNGETIRNNVTFMADENEGDESKIIECLKCCQIWDDIKKMPDGLDTLIGENGTAISGGQRQRIALARALYKDFEILIMDEATAALDMETEKAVIDSIRQIKGNKTLLMVTHHMSLANECEHIYRIDNKKFIKVR